MAVATFSSQAVWPFSAPHEHEPLNLDKFLPSIMQLLWSQGMVCARRYKVPAKHLHSLIFPSGMETWKSFLSKKMLNSAPRSRGTAWEAATKWHHQHHAPGIAAFILPYDNANLCQIQMPQHVLSPRTTTKNDENDKKTAASNAIGSPRKCIQLFSPTKFRGHYKTLLDTSC